MQCLHCINLPVFNFFFQNRYFFKTRIKSFWKIKLQWLHICVPLILSNMKKVFSKIVYWFSWQLIDWLENFWPRESFFFVFPIPDLDGCQDKKVEQNLFAFWKAFCGFWELLLSISYDQFLVCLVTDNFTKFQSHMKSCSVPHTFFYLCLFL